MNASMILQQFVRFVINTWQSAPNGVKVFASWLTLTVGVSLLAFGKDAYVLDMGVAVVGLSFILLTITLLAFTHEQAVAEPEVVVVEGGLSRDMVNKTIAEMVKHLAAETNHPLTFSNGKLHMTIAGRSIHYATLKNKRQGTVVQLQWIWHVAPNNAAVPQNHSVPTTPTLAFVPPRPTNIPAGWVWDSAISGWVEPRTMAVGR